MYGIINLTVFIPTLYKNDNRDVLSKNTAFSQPYYSVHPFTHLLRGEVKLP